MKSGNKVRLAAGLGIILIVGWFAFAVMWHRGFNCYYFRDASSNSLWLELAISWGISLYFSACLALGRFRIWQRIERSSP